MAHGSDAKQLSKAVEAVGHAVAGGVAGMAAITLFYPLSSVSTRLQVQAREAAAGSQTNKTPYKGTWDAFKRVTKEEGVLAFYSGLKASLIGIAASNTVYFYWYSFLREHAIQLAQRKELTALESLGVSTIAGVINVVSTLPIWVVNTRMQLDTTKSLKEQLLTVYNDDGVKGFYKGIIPSLILVSNPAVQFMVFERLKSLLLKRGGRKRLSATDAFLLGAVAKLVATLVTFPYLLVKSRLQAKGTQGVIKYAGFVDAVTRIFAADGLRGFYKGINSKLVQTVLGAAFMFWVKEKVVVYTMFCIVLLNKALRK
jgi:adenine nucleotide transporter 17